MLDKMREGSQGIAAKIVLVVIILSFALAGVSSYLGGSNEPVAVIVNDQEITEASVEQAYQNERASLQQQYGEQFEILASNPSFAQQVRAQATQGLISDTLIKQAIEEMGLRVGDEQVKNEIRAMQEFQVDGKFNNEQYLALLRRASYTPARFSQGLKQDLARRQLLEMLIGSEFVLPSEVKTLNQLQAQQRVAKVMMINSADFADVDAISEQQINEYYQENSDVFQSAEQVSVDYILLDADNLADQVVVTDADIEAYYDNHHSDYQRAERRKVAHILVQGNSDEAQQKAAALLVQINDGADFATLAAENSDDTFSAANQGELDWFEAGVMDPAFDEASFALTQDAPISELVESQFGFHIIKLIDVDASEALPLADVKARVEAALVKAKTTELYYELHQTLSEVAFESPDSLDEASAAISVDVQHSALFNVAEAPTELDNRALLQIVFDQDFRDEGLNSELIDLEDNQAIVVRVNEYQEAAIKPLAEVTEQIKTDLTAQLAQASAQQFAESIIAKLNNQQPIDAEIAEKGVAFSTDVTFNRFTREFDYQLIQALYKLPKPQEGEISRQSVALTNGNYAVLELSKVIEETLQDEQALAQIESLLTRSMSDSTYQLLIAQLTADASIKYPVVD